MVEGKFKEILDFAIGQEKQAAEFYQKLQGVVKHEWSKKILKELENMEWGHKKLLENWDSEGIEKFTPPNITDLKISDYMEEIEANDQMSYQEILITAMKREEAAKSLYLDLAKKSANEATRNLFLKLSAEEAKHKLQLETVYDDEILVEN